MHACVCVCVFVYVCVCTRMYACMYERMNENMYEYGISTDALCRFLKDTQVPVIVACTSNQEAKVLYADGCTYVAQQVSHLA